MNTNHDAFENDLRALQRRELPAGWRDEILKAAQTIQTVPRTPRWLVAGWSVAWAAILLMHFTTPAEPYTQPSSARTTRGAPAMLWEQRTAAIEALLAAN